MLTYFEICVARLLYAGCPACELRDTVIALAYTFARRGSVLPWLFDTFARVGSIRHGSLTHIPPGEIFSRRFLDTQLAGWDL